MTSRIRSRSATPPLVHEDTRHLSLVESLLPPIHHEPSGRQVWVHSIDGYVEATNPRAETLVPENLGDLCSRCLKWSLTNNGSPLGHKEKSSQRHEINKLEEWGIPLEMKDSNCALCRLFALHSIDYGTNPMDGRAYTLYELSYEIVPKTSISADGFPSSARFWYLYPTSGLKAGDSTLMGPGACIGRLRTAQASRTQGPRALQLRTDKIDYSRIQQWLYNCRTEHHGLCDAQSVESLPSLTLVDCLSMPPKLVKARPHHRYAAISYVWGVAGKSRAYQVGDVIDLSTVPRTVRDAMLVARKLGLFFWVDRYCIPQDPTVMQEQVSKMDVVYSGAELTIIAAAGSDIEYGLPGVGCRQRIQQPYVKVGDDIYVSILQDPEAKLQSTNWWQRAWCFQEALLSRKRLVFTEEQMYMQCRKSQAVETLSHQFELEDGFMPQTILKRTPPTFYSFCTEIDSQHLTSKTIYDILYTYSVKDMTFESDGLNAIAGILRNLSLTKSVDKTKRFASYAGLPIVGHNISNPKNFLAALSWTPFGRSNPKRRRGHHFPSWSWSGFIGSFRCANPQQKSTIDPEIQLEIIDHDDKPIKWQKFVELGQLKKSIFPPTPYIHLDVLTADIELKYFKSTKYQDGIAVVVSLQHFPDTNGVRYSQVMLNYPKPTYRDFGISDSSKKMKCFMLWKFDPQTKVSGTGILLRPLSAFSIPDHDSSTPTNNGDSAQTKHKCALTQYERIGMVDFSFAGDIFDSVTGEHQRFLANRAEGSLEELVFEREWICLG